MLSETQLVLSETQFVLSETQLVLSETNFAVWNTTCAVWNTTCAVWNTNFAVWNTTRAVWNNLCCLKHKVCRLKHNLCCLKHEFRCLKHNLCWLKHKFCSLTHNLCCLKHKFRCLKHNLCCQKTETKSKLMVQWRNTETVWRRSLLSKVIRFQVTRVVVTSCTALPAAWPHSLTNAQLSLYTEFTQIGQQTMKQRKIIVFPSNKTFRWAQNSWINSYRKSCFEFYWNLMTWTR